MNKVFAKVGQPRTARFTRYGKESADTKPTAPTHTKVIVKKARNGFKEEHKRVYHESGHIRNSNVDAQNEAYTRMLHKAQEAQIEWQQLFDAVKHNVLTEQQAKAVAKVLAAEKLKRSPV